MADDAVAFIRARGLEHLDLFGFSMGGFAVQSILERHPQVARRAILADTVAAHLAAIIGWGQGAKRDLSKIAHPVLVANGDNDVMAPTSRSFDLFLGLPNAQLSIFPDAGHGGVFQYHDVFVDQLSAFLA